jgi:hypothetical protein
VGRYLSKTTVSTFALLFVAGVAAGIPRYTQRSPIVEEQVPGANAVPAHIVLALVAIGLLIGLPRLRLAQQAPYPIWVAPFAQSGLDRLKQTMQVIGGLDPNFTTNAWGGPSYLGAMLAHYLDAAYLFYIQALLLNLVLVKQPAGLAAGR